MSTVCDVIITSSIVYFLRSEQALCDFYLILLYCMDVELTGSLTGGGRNMFNNSGECLSFVCFSLGKNLTGMGQIN